MYGRAARRTFFVFFSGISYITYLYVESVDFLWRPYIISASPAISVLAATRIYAPALLILGSGLMAEIILR